MRKKDEQWSVFWCGLLRPVLFGEVKGRDVNRYLKKLCEQEYVFPDGRRRRPSVSTLRRKLRKYRKDGFKSLARKRRSDLGRPRAVPQAMLERAVELKKEQPRRSDETINRFLRQEFGRGIARSTLYRLLKEAGATRLKLGIVKKKVRCRWTRQHTHDLWLGDFEEGPYVLDRGEPTATHLSAFIDCHSRYVVEGRYYFRQNLDILIDSLLRAWAAHGASAELYLDNAKVYHSNGLKAACYALGIRLIHRTAGDPSPGGLIERFFQTAQSQFEAEARAGSILTLEQLNRAFSAWLAVSYHQRKHSETAQTPQDRYEQGRKVIRHVDTTEILQYFMRRESRKVDPDFSDIQLNGRFYRVDPRLRGDKVEVRFDPFSTMETVLIYSDRDQYLGLGVLHDRRKRVDQTAPAGPLPKPANNYLDLLVRQHEQQLNAQAAGIDFRAAIDRGRTWPFTAFLKKLAHLLGRKGMSDFNARELEAVKKAYGRHRALSKAILDEAFLAAPDKALTCVLYHLHVVANKRKET